jgi:hypothetical protein
MKRALLSSVIALLAIPASAHAATPSCQRGGAKLLAASGSVRIVSVKHKRAKHETRHDRISGCWASTGRRFSLFDARDFGLDEIEHDHFEILDGRYIGAIRDFEGGVSESRTAATWDAFKRKRVHDTKPCDQVSSGDFAGVEDAVFFHGGGIAYTCWEHIHLADAHGDRELEPAGTRVTSLAVSRNSRSFAERLYYTVADTTFKSLIL